MRKTFICDESMIITIPIGSLKNIQEGQLMPENFHCVFRDNFKVFAVRGKPKPLGAAQAIGGKCSNMHMAKLSFSMNIICFFCSLVLFSLYVVILNSLRYESTPKQLANGIIGLIMTLLVFECMISLFLIYWLSKAVCREHFNTLVCMSLFLYKPLLYI
ncbi:hypothetical protein GOODEAATRI_002501 [Goodea atripinnis]|uniref:Uncharacterized protein n=1 Tax=Goodea atripinnis TaxID=208336 RepID=A0ABV0PK83_9TELE